MKEVILQSLTEIHHVLGSRCIMPSNRGQVVEVAFEMGDKQLRGFDGFSSLVMLVQVLDECRLVMRVSVRHGVGILVECEVQCRSGTPKVSTI